MRLPLRVKVLSDVRKNSSFPRRCGSPRSHQGFQSVPYGRLPGDIAILPGLTPIVAETTEEAVAIYDQLNGFLKLDPEDIATNEVRFGGLGREKHRNLSAVSRLIGVDLVGRDHGAVVEPNVLDASNEEGRALFAEITRRTRRDVVGENRILYKDLIFAAGQRSAIVVGNPEEVADYIQLWFEAEAADGFNIFPAYVPDAVDAFARLVVPILQNRGLFRRDYEGPTFRDHLKLQRPPNRFNDTSRRPATAVA